MMKVVVGIFVGGSSKRMGGSPKGLLPAPDGSANLVERLIRVARQATDDASVVLVGAQPAYTASGVPVIADDPAGVGPIGGLRALLVYASHRGSDAIALACDLPFLTTELIERIAQRDPARDAVAPRINGRWEPLCALYGPEACLPIVDNLLSTKRYAVHRVLDMLGDRAASLPLESDDVAMLKDWDTPDDIGESRR